MSRSKPTVEPTAGMSGAHLTRLVYELLDAHDDTARLAGDLASDPHWQVHLDYLRDLQRHGRESLARAAAAPHADVQRDWHHGAQANRATTGFRQFLERVAKPRHHTSTPGQNTCDNRDAR
jgi:hypothetical protein